MNKYLAFAVAVGIGAALLTFWLLRYAAFAVLMFVRPLVSLVFGLGAGLCLLGLVLGFLIASDRHVMLWAFFCAGLGSTIILFCYDALVLALAPKRFPMLLAR